MKDLSLHLLDILENSAKGGAGQVIVDLIGSGTRLTVRIADDGPGLPAVVRNDPTDPFSTTRRERRVGLGLSLLREAAEQCGGRLHLEHPSHGGFAVTAEFDLSHLDAKPLGDMTQALVTAVLAWPHLDLMLTLGPEHRAVFCTRELKQQLDGVPLSHPDVVAFLRRTLADELAPLYAWSESIALRLPPPHG